MSDWGLSRSTVMTTVRAALWLSASFCSLLTGCTPVNDPSAGLSVPETVALIDSTPRSDILLPNLAEAFALGTRATDVQRDQLEKNLVGRTVEWDLPVYDVGFADGRFDVTSQMIPTSNRAEAVPLLRVMVFVVPQGEADQALLMKVKTDDVIRVRGIVQEIRARAVVVVPGVVVGVPDTSEPTTSAETTS